MTRPKMHDGEIDTDIPLVRRLLDRQFPAWAGLPIEAVTSAGTDNALYRLGGEMVVRLPRVQWDVEDAEREHRWLPRLAPLLPVTIPVPLALGEPSGDFPWHWSVYPWLPGENPEVDAIVDASRLAVELAQFVVALHSVELAGGPSARRGVPLADRDHPTRAALDALGRAVDAAAVTAVWEEALDVPTWPGPAVWIHGDLSPGNLLCVDGGLSAVIDFGSLGVGDPACDLIVAWNLLPGEVRARFRAALGVDEATWLRGRGWALSIALIQLPYYQTTNPPLAANARHVIGQVLADRRSAVSPGSAR